MSVDPQFAPILIDDRDTAASATLVPIHDGGFLAHGYFDFVNGEAVPGIARLDSGGRLDSGFVFEGARLAQHLIVSLDDGHLLVLRPVYDLDARTNAVQVERHLPSLLGRYLDDGSRDDTFAPASDGNSNTPPPAILAALPDGKTLIAGHPAARLNVDGTVDTTFAPDVPTDDVIVQAVPFDDGRLLVEVIPEAGGETPYVSAPGLLLLAADGSVAVDYATAVPDGEVAHIAAITSDHALILLHGVPTSPWA